VLGWKLATPAEVALAAMIPTTMYETIDTPFDVRTSKIHPNIHSSRIQQTGTLDKHTTEHVKIGQSARGRAEGKLGLDSGHAFLRGGRRGGKRSDERGTKAGRFDRDLCGRGGFLGELAVTLPSCSSSCIARTGSCSRSSHSRPSSSAAAAHPKSLLHLRDTKDSHWKAQPWANRSHRLIRARQ
jgi:hypothetical protein